MADNKSIRKFSVGTDWERIVADNSKRTNLMIQNLAGDATEIGFGANFNGDGIELGFVTAGAGGAHAGTRYEMSERMGNLTTEAIYARASAGTNELIVVESPADSVRPELSGGVSSSSSSSSSSS